MHLSLEQFQAILAKTATPSQRHQWVQHVVECEHCGRAFKALHALHRSEHPVTRSKTLKYLVGVAAVLAMSAIPYFRSTPDKTPSTVDLDTVITRQQPAQTDLLARVHQINYQTALNQWGRGSSMSDLVELSNQTN